MEEIKEQFHIPKPKYIKDYPSFFRVCGCDCFDEPKEKTDCYFYHGEPHMGATILTCNYYEKLGYCPCKDCDIYISNSEVSSKVYKAVKEYADKKKSGKIMTHGDICRITADLAYKEHMNKDLIKRSDVLYVLEKTFKKYNMTYDKPGGFAEAVPSAIRNIPTAFDLESAIAKLEKRIEEYENAKGTDSVEDAYFKGIMRGYSNSLEILKSAANATNGKNWG